MADSERPDQEGAAPAGRIIHRKAQAGRAEYRARAMSLAKALRLTVAKVADEVLDMPMAVIGLRTQRPSGDDLGDALPGDGLLLLLDGPMRRRAGAVLDAALVGALIQQQTMGKVLAEPEPSTRPMTATDAAVSAPFVNAVLERAAALPEDRAEQQLIEGFRFGARVEDARTLCMALDAPDYQLLQLTLDIAGGTRQGHLTFCMPQVEAGSAVDPDTAEAEAGDAVPGQTSPQTLSETTLNLRADLRIALAQHHLSLRQLGALRVGDTLALDTANFDKVQIQTATGGIIGRGVLGQLDGQRAVQVQSTAGGSRPLQRRASDRADLDLPDVTAPAGGDAPGGAAAAQPAPTGPPPAAPAPAQEMGENGGPPDVPDLPDLNDLPNMNDLPDLPDMSDLPDLPDLPELGEDLDLPALSAG